MKTTTTVLDDLDRKLRNTWHQAIAGDRDGWPLRVPLGKPTRADLDTRFPAVQRWAIGWRDWAGRQGLELAWEHRLANGTRQPLPTHLTVPDIDTAARLVGGPWPTRLARGRARHQTLTSRFPDAAAAALVRYVDPLGDTDFTLLCEAVAWFTAHDATGLTPRQVPIEGLHGKWLNRHRSVLTALAGKDSLGLVDRPTRVHFSYLDPAHRADGGRHHDSITVGDTMTPAYPPDIAVITENKDTAVFFPQVPGGVAIEGNGFAGTGILTRIPWLAEVPRVLYWGDIDAAGYEIVNRLRGNGLAVDTVLMDFNTYTAYERYGAWTDERGNPLACQPRKDLPWLTAEERRVYEALTDPGWARVRRIEQERIPLGVAVDALTAAPVAEVAAAWGGHDGPGADLAAGGR